MIQLPWLDDISLAFPAPETALTEPDGLLAAGGDLSPERLIEAYRQGIFPWYSDGQPILWWSPDPRAVLFPTEVHISRSMRKILRQGRFDWTFDRDFEAVIDACAAPRDGEPGTWITDEMYDAYCQLHRLGVAHSVEVWQAGHLVGGLYGLALGRVFFGESMFSRATNASKVAFIQLARQLDDWGFTLLDGQVGSPHLFSLGAREIPRREFMRHLASIQPGERDSTWGRQAPANHLE